MNELLGSILKSYQGIPNAPFSQKHTSRFIRDFIEKNDIKYSETEHHFIINPEKIGTGKRKLLLLAHTDHPGIVMESSRTGRLFGLKDTRKISEYIASKPVKIRMYPNDKSTDQLCMVNFQKINAGHKHIIDVDHSDLVKKNFIGQYDLENYKDDQPNHIELYNADDGVMVAILLFLVSEKLIGENFETYIAFMKHEEVHQLSSWEFAKSNPISLTTDDFILNMECLKAESINEGKFGKVNYEDGLILQLSNTGCLFGYKNNGANMLELLIRNISSLNKFPLQIGIIKDSCDSRSFTEFAISPNICSITIPNRYKHNGTDDGFIRLEEIKKSDIENTISLIRALTNDTLKFQELKQEDSISYKLKLKKEVTDISLLKRKEILNKRLAIAYKDMIRRGYFFPEKTRDYLYDYYYKAISYVLYFYLHLKLKFLG